VQPDGAAALEALEEEPLTSTGDPHAEALRERTLDRDLSDMPKVGVLLADDLALKFVFAE
jgi:hypothetical protein